MKIRIFLDYDEILIAEGVFTIQEIERHTNGNPPYALIELNGDITNYKIQKPSGMYLYPEESIQQKDFVLVTKWRNSLV